MDASSGVGAQQQQQGLTESSKNTDQLKPESMSDPPPQQSFKPMPQQTTQQSMPPPQVTMQVPQPAPTQMAPQSDHQNFAPQPSNHQSLQLQTHQLAQQLAQQLAMQNQGSESQGQTMTMPVNNHTQPTNQAPMPKPPGQLPTIQSLLQSISPQTNPSGITMQQSNQQSNAAPRAPTTPQKAVVTQVKLMDELNILDWFKSNDIIHQIAEKARSSMDSVITVLDPGMKEYLYSGGDINVMVLCSSEGQISPIRDAFQTIFGRATVSSAKSTQMDNIDNHPIKLAQGFQSASIVARQKVDKLRLNTSNVPQNQVIIVVQPCIVTVIDDETARVNVTQGINPEKTLVPKWFFTFNIILDDPVLGTTINSYSQLIPIDTDIVAIAKEAKYPEGFNETHLGFPLTIGELMYKKLKLVPPETDDRDVWLGDWAGLDCDKIMYDAGATLASTYKRKWNDNMTECQ